MASALFTMTMTISPPDFHSKNESNMSVELVNSGNEPAFRATATLKYPEGMSADAVSYERLNPNNLEKRVTSVKAQEGMLPGTYPLILSLQFHDSNNYPIYMIFDSSVEVDGPSVSMIHGSLTTTEFPMDSGGTLRLQLRNADTKPHTVRARLLVPDSLSAENPEKTVQMPAHSEAIVDYQVTNFMALQDSNLMVLAIMEYDDDMHHSSFAQGRIKIINRSERPKLPFFIAAAAVILCACAYYFHNQRSMGTKQSPKGRQSNKMTSDQGSNTEYSKPARRTNEK
jgi:hypothetical protein